jgi:hypothetical protein
VVVLQVCKDGLAASLCAQEVCIRGREIPFDRERLGERGVILAELLQEMERLGGTRTTTVEVGLGPGIVGRHRAGGAAEAAKEGGSALVKAERPKRRNMSGESEKHRGSRARISRSLMLNDWKPFAAALLGIPYQCILETQLPQRLSQSRAELS